MPKNLQVEVCKEHEGYIEDALSVHGISPFAEVDGHPAKYILQIKICQTFIHLAQVTLMPLETFEDTTCPICYLNKYDFSRWIGQSVGLLERYLSE